MKERKDGNKQWKKEETVVMRGELEKRNLFPNKIKLKSQFILLDNISLC